MFKMGCSMARKILGPGSGAATNEQMGACSSSVGGNNGGAGGNSNKKNRANENNAAAAGAAAKPAGGANKSTGELDDFSKLEEDPRLPLNVRQIFKITKSWKAIARTMSKTGTAMFLNLFEQNQDLFYLFDRFQHLKGKELHESMELREHAATVMSTLDQSINSLGDYDNFVSYLHSIGQLHRKVPGFRREYFWKIEQPFMKAVKQTLDERCNETIEQIYMIAIKLIIEMIAEGYGHDDESQDAQRELELTRGGGGGGGGGGAGAGGHGAGNGNGNGNDGTGTTSDGAGSGKRACDDAAGGGGRGDGVNKNQKGQPEGAGGNENSRAGFAGGQQHRSGAPPNPVERLCCPLEWQLEGGDRISERSSMGASSSEQVQLDDDAILVEATCELMKTTSSWLGQMNDESGQLRQLLGNLNERLLSGDQPTNNEEVQAEQAASRVNSKVNNCEQAAAFNKMIGVKSDREDSRKASRRRQMEQTTKKKKEKEKTTTTTTKGCPLNPATQLDKREPPVFEAGEHQIFIASSSCPARCQRESTRPIRASLEASQREVQGSRGSKLTRTNELEPIVKPKPEGEKFERPPASSFGEPGRPNLELSADCASARGEIESRFGADDRGETNEGPANRAGRNNENEPRGRAGSWRCARRPQVTRESIGQRASDPDNQREIPRDHQAAAAAAAAAASAPSQVGDLIKSDAHGGRNRLNGKVNSAPRLPIKASPSKRGNRVGARPGRDQCERQSQNNNKSEITTNRGNGNAQDDAAPLQCDAVEVQRDDHDDHGQRKQGRPLELKLEPELRRVDVIPNDSSCELRAGTGFPRAPTKFEGLLHKSERAIVKLLAGDDEKRRPAGNELGELIKVLLLINRLLLTLAEKSARPAPNGGGGAAAAGAGREGAEASRCCDELGPVAPAKVRECPLGQAFAG